MNYLLICSPESFKTTLQTGVIGYYDDMINRSGKDFVNAQEGDRVFIYVSGKKGIDAVSEVVKGYYFDDKKIFSSHKTYIFPHRIEVKILKKDIGLDFKTLVDRLEMIKDKTGRVVYSAYFVKSFMALSDKDAALLSKETGMREAVSI